jgi:hypothetical protein
MKSTMNTIKTIILLFCVAIAHVGLGQSSAPSVYNAFGIGRLTDFGLGSLGSSGNASIGLRSDYLVNLKNPASFNSIKWPNQILDVGISFGGFSQKTTTESDQTMIGGLQNLNMWFKPNEKFAFVFGMNQYSNTNYNIMDTYEYSEVVKNYSVSYKGSGGLSRIYFGASRNITKNLHLGARASLLVGQMGQIQTITNNSIVENSQLTKTASGSKMIVDFGAQYTLPVFNGKRIDIGITYQPAFRFDQSVESSIFNTNYDTLINTSTETLKLPEKYGFGVSGHLGSWTVFADAELEKWSSAYNDGEENAYHDKYSVSFGMEYIRNRYSEHYIDRMSWRTGISYNNHYVSIRNQNLNQASFSFGVGLPTQHRSGNINIGYNYEGLGTTQSDLVLETIHKITLNVSIGNLWFVKTIYD